MADLATRVERVEREVERLRDRTRSLDSRDGATAMAVNLVHEQLVQLDRRVEDGFAEMREGFTAADERLVALEGLLEQVLQRLPAPPEPPVTG